MAPSRELAAESDGEFFLKDMDAINLGRRRGWR
jgi:hypothetical protein